MNAAQLRRLELDIGGGWTDEDHRDWRAQIPEIAAITEVFPSPGDDRAVLDIGLERAFKAIPLAQDGYRVSGLDFDQERIAAREEVFYRPHGIEVRRCDVTAEPIPYDCCSFDCVMLNGVIEHWYESPFFALGEIARILKPGGRLVVTTPNAANLRKRLWLLFGHYPYVALDDIYNATHPHAFHHREHTMRELCGVLTRAGFDIAERRFRDAFHRAAPTLLRRLYWFVTRGVPPFRDQLIVVGRKPAA